MTYFPALRWGRLEAIEAMATMPKQIGTEDLPLFPRLGWGGSDSGEMVRAYNEALAFCMEV